LLRRIEVIRLFFLPRDVSFSSVSKLERRHRAREFLTSIDQYRSISIDRAIKETLIPHDRAEKYDAEKRRRLDFAHTRGGISFHFILHGAFCVLVLDYVSSPRLAKLSALCRDRAIVSPVARRVLVTALAVALLLFSPAF